eukprot:1145600-Pelagomonas_calceolata.AAC.3
MEIRLLKSRFTPRLSWQVSPNRNLQNPSAAFQGTQAWKAPVGGHLCREHAKNTCFFGGVVQLCDFFQLPTAGPAQPDLMYVVSSFLVAGIAHHEKGKERVTQLYLHTRAA